MTKRRGRSRQERLAEEEGFEPPGRLSSASRFQGGPVKPLRHSSAAIMPNSLEKVYAAHGNPEKVAQAFLPALADTNVCPTNQGSMVPMKRTVPWLLVLLLAGGGSGATPPEKAAAREGLPAGFELSVYAEGLDRARFMSFGPAYAKASAGKPDGDGWVLYVGTNSDKVYALPDKNRDGRADAVIVFASGLRSPHSVAWHEIEPPGGFITPKPRPKPQGWLYVGETHRVIRLRDTNGDFEADGPDSGEQEVVDPNLPTGGQHFTRTVGFGADGGLYVSVGSSCNACREEDARRAALLRFNAHRTRL